MTTMTGKTTDDERGLLPYPVIIVATKGEPQAMNIVVQHYAGYISHLSMRTLRDERGNTPPLTAYKRNFSDWRLKGKEMFYYFFTTFQSENTSGFKKIC